jgi:hypothetical protein
MDLLSAGLENSILTASWIAQKKSLFVFAERII